MTVPSPFTPSLGVTKSVSATSTSSNVALAAVDYSSTPTPASSGPSGGNTVIRVLNAGPNTAFVRWGIGSTVTAVTADMPILAGSVEVFSKAPADNYAAAITAGSDTATVYFTCGEGV